LPGWRFEQGPVLILRQILPSLEDDPARLPASMPPDLAAIVRKASAIDPTARYTTADALADERGHARRAAYAPR
jgi:serine/threonine protein kinase